MRKTLLMAALLLGAIACQNDQEPTPALPQDATAKGGNGGGKGGGGKGATTYLTGDAADIHTNTEFGLVLMGGGPDVDEAMHWLLERSGGGDVVIIRASGSDGYNDYLYNMYPVNSVETIIINSSRAASDAAVEQKIRNAEALFIAGGNQDDYVSYWKGSPVEAAINYLANTKKVPIGGTSAGLAILGEYYYSASNGTVYSYEALEDPYNTYMAGIGGGFLNIPYLQNTITDTHYSERDRHGRHFTFMARLVQDFGVSYSNARGIGVDEETAACIDASGSARAYGIGDVYFIAGYGGSPEVCQPETALSWYRSGQAADVYRLPANSSGSNSFSVANWSTGSGGTWFYWWADNGIFREE